MAHPTPSSLTLDGDFRSYFADNGPDAPQLLVLQEIYGVNEEVRRVVDFHAVHGYTALAPDLLWRVQPGQTFEYARRDAARDAIGLLAGTDIVADIRRAADVLRRRQARPRPIALLAFGWGGQYALAAARDGGFAAVASYYPGNLAPHVATAAAVAAPLLFHFSAIDPRTPPEMRSTLRQALATRDDVEIFTHPGVDHGFANHGRPEFDAATAAAAERQTLDFLARAAAHWGKGGGS